MGSSREVTRTEQRIAEVDAMHQTVEQLQQDLQAYRTALRQEIAALRQKSSPAPAPAGRAPTRPTPGKVPLPPLPTEPVELEPADDEVAPVHGAPGEGYFRELGEDEEERQKENSEFDVGVPPSPFEEDQGDRIGGKPVSVMISDGTATEEPLSGWVIDRPPGGLKILVDEQLQVGMVIGVRPTREHPHAQWINCSIKAIKPERSSFILTCTFVNRPPWNALALLNN